MKDIGSFHIFNESQNLNFFSSKRNWKTLYFIKPLSFKKSCISNRTCFCMCIAYANISFHAVCNVSRPPLTFLLHLERKIHNNCLSGLIHNVSVLKSEFLFFPYQNSYFGDWLTIVAAAVLVHAFYTWWDVQYWCRRQPVRNAGFTRFCKLKIFCVVQYCDGLFCPIQ